MAFERRTWLARIGTGLNKFIIGAKDAGGKQTLTNSPDSVTQQGDVISADNLNDLEERIEDGLNEKVDPTDLNDALAGMKLTKVWENPNPTATFENQVVSFATSVEEMIIVYSVSASLRGYYHMKGKTGRVVSPSLGGRLSKVTVDSASFVVWGRTIGVNISETSTLLTFGNGRVMNLNLTSSASTVPEMTITTDNSVLVPLEIYSVGDIYNS